VPNGHNPATPQIGVLELAKSVLPILEKDGTGEEVMVKPTLLTHHAVKHV
jgi:hypothetical protein